MTPRNRYILSAFNHYLHVRLDPHFHFTAASADALHRDAAGTARRQRLTRVLIEGDAPQSRMGMLEVFNLGKVVHNRGGVVGFFASAGEARAWLRLQPPGIPAAS